MASHDDPVSLQPAGGRQPAGGKAANGKLVEYERYIEDQLRKTRGHVRSVDIAGSLMTWAAGTLAFFFLAAMIDHWVVKGGLGFWSRLLLLAGYLVAAFYYLATELLPHFLRRINPVYAAQTIERSRPTLKNALVNFLMFRANPEGLSRVVYQAIEEQAATNLAKVHVEAAVDRSNLIRIGYALVGILLVCALYIFLSPKDLLRTVRRVAMPWAEISAPTRTAISEIEPGNAPAFRGQQVTVSARIQGLPSDGKVTLFYSTVDGQIVERPLEMTLPIDGYWHECVLPAADVALQQSLDYRITAGDATSKSFRIEVVAAPTIVVHAIEYKYPSYTELLTQRIEHQGDIKAIEGTLVTLEAVANQDIESASIDFDCDGKPDVRMQADKLEAKATFRLKLKDDLTTPEHTCYQLLFKNATGQQNPQPVRHQIEVTRDLPPEIQFVSPKQDEIDLPLNTAMNLEIVANDPDFALRLVKLSASSHQQALLDQMLLGEQRRGQFVKKFRFEPRQLGLKAGDVVEYSAVAEDNKDPHPSRTQTPKRRIRIVSPSRQAPSQDQLAKNDQPGDAQQGGDDGNSGGDKERLRVNANQGKEQTPDPKSEKPFSQPKSQDDAGAEDRTQEPLKEPPADSQQGQGDGQGGESSSQPTQSRPGEKGNPSEPLREADPSVPSDGSDDGDAVERILKYRDDQNESKQKPGDRRQQRPGDQKDSADQKSGDQDKSIEQPSGDGGQNDQQAGGQGRKTPKDDRQKGGQPPGQDARDRKSAQQDNPDPRQKPDPDQRGDEKQPGQPGDDRQDGPKPESSQEQKPNKSDRSPGQKGEKGSGPSGPDEDSADGQQGREGRPGKGSTGKGQSGQSGESQDAAGQDASKNGARGGKGKPTDPKPGDEKLPTEKGDGSRKGKGTQREITDGEDQNPQADDRSGKQQKSGAKPNAKDPTKADGSNGQNREGEPAGKPEDKANDKKADRADKGQAKQDRRTPDESGNATPDKSEAAGDAKQGQGGQSKDDASQDAGKKSSRDKQYPDAKGGDGENEKGESGAGEAGQESKGSPTPQQSQPRNKSQKPSDGEKDAKQDDAPQSPSISNKESDSQGIDDGDRSGAGKKGGGQKANKSGTGGAGQNTAADEGAGRSDESGKGETSGRAGGDRAADKPTGQSGSEKGNGSASKPSSNNAAKPGDGKGSQADPSQSQSSESGQPSDSNNQQPGQPGSQNSGQPAGGKSNNGPQPGPGFGSSGNGAEQANLDYARKSTDLALEHLRNQLRKDQPDPELLNRLGWERKDLENFVRRWEQMRKAAQVPGEQGAASRQELDETLRSLGLRPHGSRVGGSTGRDDQSRGYKESRRTSPPPEYAPQYKAYQQGTSRGGK